MKNALKLIICAVFIVPFIACGKNPAKPQEMPPVPKPKTPVETAAFAAKKADYFIRLAFDLADGYLYDNSVARKRYGTDSNYVNSLNFNRAYDEGIISSRDFGTFEFWYYRDRLGEPPPQIYDVVITSYTTVNFSDLPSKRMSVVNTADAGNNPAKRFDIKFMGADTGSDNFTFDIWYSSTQHWSTRDGAYINNPSMVFGIIDDLGAFNSFTANFTNINGKIQPVYAGDAASPAKEFIMQGGTLNITDGIYNISLTYSNNKADGLFTGPSGFSANIYLNYDGNYGAYYIESGSPDVKRYIGWDFP